MKLSLIRFQTFRIPLTPDWSDCCIQLKSVILHTVECQSCNVFLNKVALSFHCDVPLGALHVKTNVTCSVSNVSHSPGACHIDMKVLLWFLVWCLCVVAGSGSVHNQVEEWSAWTEQGDLWCPLLQQRQGFFGQRSFRRFYSEQACLVDTRNEVILNSFWRFK